MAGTVLIDGQPLTKGFVRFIPDTGRAASGELDAQGRFELSTFEDRDGALIGRHRVEVIAVENPTAQKVRYLTPIKYRSSDTSGIEFEFPKPEAAWKSNSAGRASSPRKKPWSLKGRRLQVKSARLSRSESQRFSDDGLLLPLDKLFGQLPHS